MSLAVILTLTCGSSPGCAGLSCVCHNVFTYQEMALCSHLNLHSYFAFMPIFPFITKLITKENREECCEAFLLNYKIYIWTFILPIYKYIKRIHKNIFTIIPSKVYCGGGLLWLTCCKEQVPVEWCVAQKRHCPLECIQWWSFGAGLDLADTQCN